MFDASLLSGNPEIMVFGMLAALLAAATWLLIASNMGWPVSTTHSIVGAIIGFAVVGIGADAVNWGKVGQIAMSWVASPLTAGVVAYLLFTSVQRLVLETSTPLANAKRYVPFYMFAAGFFLTLVTLFKGLKHVGLDLSTVESYSIATVIGIVIMLIGTYFIRKIKLPEGAGRAAEFASVERVFGVLMVVTACSMAFAHGSNDVANAVGPVAAVISVAQSGEVLQKSALPLWVLMLGGVGIVVGLATYGRFVIETVGRNITHLTPSRGFAAELAAAGTVVVASGTGMPISTTHTLVGAVMGVGIARGIAALNLGVVRSIFLSWIITLPAGALLSITFFYILRALLS
jgi:PiT family inorganic phosphate transporter